MIDEILHAHFIGILFTVHLIRPDDHAVVKQRKGTVVKQPLERFEIKPRLFLCVVSIDKQEPHLIQFAILLRSDELLRCHPEVSDVGNALALEVSPYLIGIVPERINHSRIYERHLTALQVILKCLPDHKRHESPERSYDDSMAWP